MGTRQVELLMEIRDNAGHAFGHTYKRKTPDRLFRSSEGRQEIMGSLELFARKVYKEDILQKVPFLCVSCGCKASHKHERFYWLQMTADSDVRVVNHVKPVCKPGPCEKVAEQLLVDENFPGADEPHIHHCETCDKVDVAKLCSRCKRVFYCSRECQKLDWPNHKSKCK